MSMEARMRKILLGVLMVMIASLVLTACSSKHTDAPAKAVEDYLNALVAKDADRLPSLVCGDWENDALLELDSFQAVTAKLDNVACTQTGIDGDTTLVKCTGNIVTTYNNENQNIDLSVRTYQVVQE